MHNGVEIQKGTFDWVLEKIRSESRTDDGKIDTIKLGTSFERIIVDFFKTDKHYSNRFSKVWLWKDWPKNDGPDRGIDIVAEEHDGTECAVQCKCYSEDGMLDLKAVAKVIAAAESFGIKNRIVVYTGENITPNAIKTTRGSNCSILQSAHLRESSVDWSEFPKLKAKKPKTLREYQQKACDDVLSGFKKHARGKLVMACGTGKTLVSLRIAEKHAGLGKTVLYMVPSISLILQSMREWSDNANIKHSYMAVCSDKSTGEDGSITELESAVSTDPKDLVPFLSKKRKDVMKVVFSTYHSSDVVKKATKKNSFDLIMCDEAHRTTGVEDESYFTLIHKDSNIPGLKRLYMTATPRVYSDIIKQRTGRVIYSMDDEKKYGPMFHELGFSEAVRLDALSDFKVKIAIVPADVVDKEFQQSIAQRSKDVDGDMELPLDERTRLAAIWHGIRYPDDNDKERLLQRVIAFCNRIDRSMLFAGEFKGDEDRRKSFKRIVKEYNEVYPTKSIADVRHIDGKNNALYRRDQMRWLSDSNNSPNECRILSNARCLSEGVDVPALDGVVFVNPRKSRVDVVQSVGRVMRKSHGKERGYVILPVAVPAGMEVNEALDDNNTFKVVWQVLNALRSHDPDFGHEINTLILDKRAENTDPTSRISLSVMGGLSADTETKFFSKVKSKLVEKVGDIDYYDKYGEKIGVTAQTVEGRIRNKLKSSPHLREHLNRFHEGLKQIINDQISRDDAMQIISQHIVLSRIFDMMFSGEFTSHNPISKILEGVADKFNLREELVKLEQFYKDAEKELEGIKSREARQNFIKKIYGNFFASTAKKETEQYGIVYTPVEVIDFIINSVQVILKENFSTEFNKRNVKVLEPFAGTGTFISRLLESGMIGDNLYEKYKNDLWANEMILLAYYIATVNIETTYSSLNKGGKYVPFEGINYTDTMMLNPRYLEDERHRKETTKIDEIFKEVHVRIRNQRKTNVNVIFGNPPYSARQSSHDDDNPNMKYDVLDKIIDATYVTRVKDINKDIQMLGSLYDSYVRSICWASYRIGTSGTIAFITNANFIRSAAAAGMRACLADKFDEIWCYDLRGNQRTQGDISKKEGGKIFGSGSRAPVAITILVKNTSKKNCTIHYKDIGDYHSKEKKLEIVKDAGSIRGIKDWQVIKPDKHYDWLDQRGGEFSRYTPIGNKETKSGTGRAVFKMYSRGVATSRDPWAYNSYETELSQNMKTHIDYVNNQNPEKPKIDPTKAKFSRGLINKLKKSKSKFEQNKIRIALYRPFFKQYLYFDETRTYNDEVGQIPKFFPENYSKNLVICVPFKSAEIFSAIVTDVTPDLNTITANQCFPLYIYENNEDKKLNITDSALAEYQEWFKDKKITKKSIFYYVYGMLHHPHYRTKFTNNLSRELPHIPMAPDFCTFSKVGEQLVDLHLNFDSCKRYNLGKPKFKPSKFRNLSFGKKKVKNNGMTRQTNDKTKLRIDGVEVFDNIPEVKYQVNGRTPLEWIIDRYKVTIDKDSGITNDPCTGTDIIAIIERAVHVGIESDKLVEKLSKLDFEPKNWQPKKTGLDQFTDSVCPDPAVAIPKIKKR